MKYLTKIRLYIGYLFFLFILLLANPIILSYGIGGVVVLLGEAIRTWAAGYIAKDEVLTKNGPYRLTRNPLYLGTFFIGLGVVIIGDSVWFLLAFTLIFLGVYIPTIFREEKFLAKKFPDDYLSYQKTVPCFFPKFQTLNVGGFSWLRVKKNKEFHTWITLFLILIILGLKLT